MDYQELTKRIIELVGGPDNIQRAWNCITRLRFNLVDNKKVDIEALKELEEVVDIQDTQSQFQIIVGDHVDEIADEINRQLSSNQHRVKTQEHTKRKKGFKASFNDLLEVIAAIFSPILPAIIGAGMMKVIISLINLFQLLPETNGIYIVFTMIGDAAFYFLPFLLAVSSARKFEVNEFVSICLAGVLMAPTLITGAGESLAPMKFLVFDIPYMNYSSSVVPIILGVWLMSYVNKLVNQIIPAMLKAIFASVLVLIITVPIVLIVFAPLGFYIGEYLSKGLIWLFANAGPFAGALLAGFNPFIVMTGMHYAIMPAAIQSIATNGFDNFWLPFALISNMAQAGAIFAVMFKTKTKEEKTVSFSTGLSAIFGITEPGMYGVTLKLKKPLYAAMIASSIAGCVVVLLKVRTFAFVAPSIFALPTYVSPEGDQSNLWIILGGIALSFALAFIFTLLVKFEPILVSKGNKNIDGSDKEQLRESPEAETIFCPLAGRVVSLLDVQDKTFSNKIIGEGVAIQPTGEIVTSPVNGIVTVLFRTKHAIGIKSDKGAEILIHIGLDTVELEGRGFEAFVTIGDQVTVGQPLLQFNKKLIENNGYQTITPIVVTNSKEYHSLKLLKIGNLSEEGEALIELT